MPVLQQFSMLACNALSFTGIYAHLSKLWAESGSEADLSLH